MKNNNIKTTPKSSSITVAAMKESSRGVHYLETTEAIANAIVRNHRSATLVDAAKNIQRGDYLIFTPVLLDDDACPSLSHTVSEMVFKVTSVADVPYTLPDHHQSLVCFSRKFDYAFHHGDINGRYQEDTITCNKDKGSR